MARFVWSVLVIVSCALACGRSSSPPPPPPPPPPLDAAQVAVVDAAPTPIDAGAPAVAPAPRRLWTDRIPDAATIEAYSVEIGGERFTKFILDTKTDAIYYFDVDVYKVHKDFIFGELLKTREDQAAQPAGRPQLRLPEAGLHDVLPGAPPRRSDVWTLAFWEGDKASAAHVTARLPEA
jgi:hypothetical protein